MKRLPRTLGLFIALICASVSSLSLAEDALDSPPSQARQQLFDSDWQFHLGELNIENVASVEDSQWRSVDLPHDWSIEGELKKSHPMGNDGGYFPAGFGWYRKTFDVPQEWDRKRVSIYFEGVYMNSEVFVNGHSLGVYPYGYSSFAYDLTEHLKPGQTNTIDVRVDNSQQKNCRWYSGSGIYRHVWLLVTDPVHVQHWGVGITTPEISATSATVEVRTIVKNDSDQKQSVTVSTRLTDNQGNDVGNARDEIELSAGQRHEVLATINVDNPQLWSPDSPTQYAATIELSQNNNDQPRDVVTEAFGIRSIEYSAEKGFMLNGQAIKLNGGCVHHDNGCLGAKAYDAAEFRKARLLKGAGFNSVRTAHNPPSEAFLDACDQIGLLVIDESFDGWRTKKKDHDYAELFDQWAKKDLQSMVLRDRNHPSIVMWSTGNEIMEREEPQAIETAKMLTAAVKEIDTTRPVTSAMTTWNDQWAMFDPLMKAHDICGYNYTIQYAETDHQRVPERVIVQTESYPRDAFSNWKLVQTHDYIIGDYVWTAMDYLGESGIGRYVYPGELKGEHWEDDFFPWHGAYCGDIDLIGHRKPISHYRDLLWNDSKTLFLAVKEPQPADGEITETRWSVWPTWESWTWPGQEGKEIEVEVYSRHPKVRLYLNDEVIGEMPTTEAEEFKATFKLPYQRGTLRAVRLSGDATSNELESVELKTAATATKMKLTADRTMLIANGQDLSFVTVEIFDAQGVHQPNAEHELSFEVTGPAIIEGVDNANLKDLDSYIGSQRKAWKGRALVVIKTTHDVGEIELKVTAAGLEPQTIRLQSSQ